MTAKKYHLIHILAFLMLFVVFFSALISSQILLRGTRIDLTEKKLWTLSASSEKILTQMKEPIEVQLFFSHRLTQESPSLHRFSQRVRGLLLEMKARTGGLIRIEYIDPKPFSEEEDRALSYRLQSLGVVNDEPLYFGLVGSNSSNKIEIIPRFNIQRQHQLEYDLIHLINNLIQTRKPSVGIVSSLPLDTGVGGLPEAAAGRAQPFLIYRQLFANYTLSFLEQNFDQVPESIDTLFIAHPKKLSPPTLYAIDQFILRGGKALILLDPFCEISQLTDARGQRIRGLGLSSDLQPLLKNWGVIYDPRDLVADRQLAQTVMVQDSVRQSPIERKYVLWLNARGSSIAQKDVMTKGLSSISLGISGLFQFVPPPPLSGDVPAVRWQPLISSSKDSQLLSKKYILEKKRTPDDLLNIFRASNQSHVLAGRLSGSFSSAYSKRPKSIKTKKGTKGRGTRKFFNKQPHLKKSVKPTDIVLVADSDFLEKRFWVHPDYYQQGVVVPVADNSTFVLNVLDALSGNEALIDLRTRSAQARSFTLVDKLRQEADQKLAAEEYRLRRKIKSIEARLAKFGKNPERTRAGLTELHALEREVIQSRRALYKVRLAANASIEQLGVWVKFFNIMFLPLVLVMLILLYPWVKGRLRAEKKIKKENV